MKLHLNAQIRAKNNNAFQTALLRILQEVNSSTDISSVSNDTDYSYRMKCSRLNEQIAIPKKLKNTYNIALSVAGKNKQCLIEALAETISHFIDQKFMIQILFGTYIYQIHNKQYEVKVQKL
jgi:vacuolar-type H+-ATPase subunit C/Vma6